jgi:hypothetical protein
VITSSTGLGITLSSGSFSGSVVHTSGLLTITAGAGQTFGGNITMSSTALTLDSAGGSVSSIVNATRAFTLTLNAGSFVGTVITNQFVVSVAATVSIAGPYLACLTSSVPSPHLHRFIVRFYTVRQILGESRYRSGSAQLRHDDE